MFNRLYVDNYRCLVNFDLPLQELSLLLGQNGVGKTSALDVMFALRQLLRGIARVTDPDIFPTKTLTRWQQRPIQKFEVEAALDDDFFKYRLEIQHEPQTRKARVWHESLLGNNKPLFTFIEGKVQLYRDDHSEGPAFAADWSESALARVASLPENKRLTRFLEMMRNVVICGIYPANIKAETVAEESLLARDANNFSAWYRHLLLERQDLVPDFTSALRRAIDGFSGLRLEKVGQDTRALMVQFEAEFGRYELRFDEISDGQRALIALYALVHLTAGENYTIFLDEPDNYVALPEIQPWLIELSDACGNGLPQAVLCSHHPELIDYLGSERGVLLDRNNSGVVTTKEVQATTIESGLRLSEAVARGWER